MKRWETLSVDLRYYFNSKLVRINSDKPLNQIIEEMTFILEKGVF
jgi:hypothetical protein